MIPHEVDEGKTTMRRITERDSHSDGVESGSTIRMHVLIWPSIEPLIIARPIKVSQDALMVVVQIR
jgi:hypothetical protein